MEIAQGVQLVAQLGAVGILMLIVYKIPVILKELREERQQGMAVIERQVESHAREMASKSNECRKERQEMVAENRKQRDEFLNVIAVFGKIDKIAEDAAKKVLAEARVVAGELIIMAAEQAANMAANMAADKLLDIMGKK